MDWAKEEELKRLQAKLRLQNKAAKKAGLLGGLAAGMGSVVAGVGSVVPGYQSPSYQPFKDEKEKDLEGGSEKVAEDAATGQDADVQEAADKGITVQEAGLARLVKEQNDDSTLAGKINSRIATARLYYDAATYPMRSELKQNRLFSLLTWDSWMFTMCGTLFFVMSVTAMWAHEEKTAMSEGRTLETDPLWHTILVTRDMMNVFSGSFWYDWHTQITFQLIKVLFSLTAVPFFIFTIGPLAKLFAHTDPTAYTRDGRITVPDPNGLSSYLRWIKEDVLNSKVHADELDERFSQKDMLNLRRAVLHAETVLENAWHKPGSARKVTTKEKLDLDKKLHKIITKEKASAELYQHCFPDHVLVDEFIEEKVQAQEKARIAEDEKKERRKTISKLKSIGSKKLGAPSAALFSKKAK